MKLIDKILIAIICIAIFAGLNSCTIGDSTTPVKSIFRRAKVKAIKSNISMISFIERGFVPGDTILLGEYPNSFETIVLDTL